MKDTLSLLFREIEHDIGTRELNRLVFDAFLNSVANFDIKNSKNFLQNFAEIVEEIKNTQPKFAIIIDHFSALYNQVCQLIKKFPAQAKNQKKIKTWLKTEAAKIIKQDDDVKKNLLTSALAHLRLDGKNILIFDHSHTIQDVLQYLHEHGQRFKVIIAEQDIEKTEANIVSLHTADIPFHVVPAYMLSHYADEVDLLLFGGVTLKSTYDFVTDTGALALISEFHLEQKPIVMCMTVSKFALWPSEKKTEIFSHPHSRKHSRKDIEYQRIKFSHDRVPADLFSQIITDEGSFTSEGIKKLYDQKFAAAQKKCH